jgi:hypothetical protein
MSGFHWLDKSTLEKELVETIGDKDYEAFISTLERLCQLPYSYRSKEFIVKYRKPLMSHEQTYQAPKPQNDADGRSFITTYGNIFFKLFVTFVTMIFRVFEEEGARSCDHKVSRYREDYHK